MSINELVEQAYENAAAHGFYPVTAKTEPANINKISAGTEIALIACELSEALEELRTGNPPMWYCSGKPEGWAVELADAVIRIMSLFGFLGLDLEEVIRTKMEYNATRPYKHEKRF